MTKKSLHPAWTELQRQVHLDFHTSPFIPDVAKDFDANAFAQAFQRAHVNSVTVFAKCHHGMSYYPTRVGVQHPALKGRDLLGEMIEALHRHGIRAPVYTTVAWEEDVARRYPEWRQMRADGSFARQENSDPTKPALPGGWWFNNFLHPDYQDYIEAHVREILGAYEVDGLFFDILAFEGHSCWSESSRRFREKRGLLGQDPQSQVLFEGHAQVAFAKRFSKMIRGANRTATIFYNSPNPIFTDSRVGVRSRHALQTHWELESLPSGFWGYHHFPRLARAFGGWGKPWLGMTGRFQKMWGDFGGLKPLPALEYECFRSQALGGGNSIGDQLPPRGRLDAGAYDLIGSVYAQCKMAEPFYAGSTRMPQVAIMAPGDPSIDISSADKSLEGAVQMCEEAKYDSAVLDDASSLEGYDLLILPDSVIPTAALSRKLNRFLALGGKVILSGRSGFGRDGVSSFSSIKLRRIGGVDIYPTFWRARKMFLASMAQSDRVVYLPGENVVAGRGTKILVDRVLPYFARNDLTFSSHFQTPPQARSSPFPAVVEGKNHVYFADPIFREYRQSGNIAVRDAWKEAMRRLIGVAPFGHGLPSTVLCVPRRRRDHLILTLLHYIPTRKALDIDMIEERSSFAMEALHMPLGRFEVRDFETGTTLQQKKPGEFLLPQKKGRLLLEVPGFFRKPSAK